MVNSNTNTRTEKCQVSAASPRVKIGVWLDTITIDAAALLERLKQYRPGKGRAGYSNVTMWRAYAVTFKLHLGCTNDLIRALEDDPLLREACGFGGELPHRTTFNRFIQRVGNHPALVERAMAGMTTEIKEKWLPKLGKQVAVDSTVVRSHSNPNRKHKSDPEASWTVKNSAAAKTGKEWAHGFKMHMAADANYGIPLAVNVTTAKRSDNPELPPLIEKAQQMYDWFKPDAVLADKGYDGRPNFFYLLGERIYPVIPRRKSSVKGGLYDGIYTADGTPTCIGQVPMKYVKTDQERGVLYRCAGCHLQERNAGWKQSCDTEVWEKPEPFVWPSNEIRRNSPQWSALYSKRQSIERVFKSMKESRRLERHHVRGLRQIRLHALMSALAYQTTVLVALRAGEAATMRWMVKAVA